jgi:uncharacterized Tic20 family protein
MAQQNSFLGTDTLPEYVPTSDDKTMAILSHVLTFVASFVAPLIIYVVKKDNSTFATDHAKESLNFQITVIIAAIICIPLIFIIIGLLLLWAIGIASIIWRIVAAIKASEGKLYRYPFCFRFIK